MAFFFNGVNPCNISNTSKQIISSLQTTFIPYYFKADKSHVILFTWTKKRSLRKRMSSPIPSSLTGGSLTVEAAFVLPLFLFFFINLLSILQLLTCYSKMETALHQTARKMSMYAYLTDTENGPDFLKELGTQLYVGKEVERRLGKDYLDHSPIRDGAAGIRYHLTDIMGGGDMIDLVAYYRVGPVFGFQGFGEFTMVNRCRVRAWTGFVPAEGAGTTEDGEEIVYVAEHGTVYHRTASCTHLKLTITRVTPEVLNTLRNENGGKYYSCELCGGRGTGSYYISPQGDRYHTSLECSGLKRNIMAVPVSQTKGMGACSRCW